MKDKILEIIEKHWTNHLYPMQNIIDCGSEIEFLIKENYVEKAFLEYILKITNYNTLDELYNLWQTQIKNK